MAENEIDWEDLARKVGALSPGTGSESGGRDYALRALEIIVGEDRLRAAVDYYVRRTSGAELARSVLWLLRPWPAMQRCHEIFHSDVDVEARRNAVELLRVVADRRALPWVQEYLEDRDALVQEWGAGVLDQLLWSRLVDADECAGLLDAARKHQSPKVRETAAFIDSFLRERREEQDRPDEADEPETEDLAR